MRQLVGGLDCARQMHNSLCCAGQCGESLARGSDKAYLRNDFSGLSPLAADLPTALQTDYVDNLETSSVRWHGRCVPHKAEESL